MRGARVPRGNPEAWRIMLRRSTALGRISANRQRVYARPWQEHLGHVKNNPLRHGQDAHATVCNDRACALARPSSCSSPLLSPVALALHAQWPVGARQREGHIAMASRAGSGQYALAPQVLQGFLHVATDAKRLERPLPMEEAFRMPCLVYGVRHKILIFFADCLGSLTAEFEIRNAELGMGARVPRGNAEAWRIILRRSTARGRISANRQRVYAGPWQEHLAT